MSVISLLIRNSGRLPFHPNWAKLRDFLSLLRGSHRVSEFSWLLLGLALFSYRVRELFICWLFFTGMFAVLALLISAGMLAWYGWKRAFYWVTPLGQIAPPVLSDPLALRLKPVSQSRR